MRMIVHDIRGSALIMAMLVMGVLTAISLLLSTLIVQETRLVAETIDAGRAYYGAEAGVEIALFELNDNLPGWDTLPQGETGHQKGYLPFEVGSAVGEFRVNNTCNAYPCFDEDFDITTAPLTSFYDVLDLNETMTIPLFVIEGGNVSAVKDFTVEFFAPFNVKTDLIVDENFTIEGWDVLRWKIFGLHPTASVTETISDFTAISSGQKEQVSVDNLGNVAERPSWFGTINCSDDYVKKSRYTDEIVCTSYVIAKDPLELRGVFGKEASVKVGVCDNTEAREYYRYDGDSEIASEDIHSCYPIREFLGSHELNYLTLTNLINPAVFIDPFNTQLQKLYFRVELFDENGGKGQTVREFASIKSNGYSGKAQQSVEVKVRRGSFMPVFNFTLYSTYK